MNQVAAFNGLFRPFERTSIDVRTHTLHQVTTPPHIIRWMRSPLLKRCDARAQVHYVDELHAHALSSKTEIGKLVARAVKAEIMVLTTSTQELHAKYWTEEEDRKDITYRKCLRTGDEVAYAGALTTMEGPNTPGLFWLEELQPPPSPFECDANYKAEWGWTKKLWEKGYKGYRIKDRIYFNNWIVLGYGMGPTRVRSAYIGSIYAELKQLVT